MSQPSRLMAWGRFLLLRVLPTVAALVGVLLVVSKGELLKSLQKVRPELLVPAVALQLAAAAVLGLRWRAALAIGELQAPPAANAMLLTLRAQAALPLLPGGVGSDMLRVADAGFARRDYRALTIVAVGERVLSAAMLGAVSAGALLLLVSPAIGLAWLALVAVIALTAWFIGRLPRLSQYRVAAIVTSPPVVFFTAANQLLALTAIAIGLSAAGLGASPLATFGVAAVGALITVLPISINGYGVRELALAALATRFGVEKEAAVAASLTATTTLLAGLVLAGLLSRLVPLRTPATGAVR